MHILFSSCPSLGHFIPLLPLAEAARRAGHNTALMTAEVMSNAVRPLRVLPVGPPLAVMLAENFRRMSSEQGEMADRDVIIANYFAGTRVDLTVDEALAAAKEFAPDLIISERADFVGPMVASALEIPWVAHTFGMSPAPLMNPMAEVAASRYTARGLKPVSETAYIDLWPDRLQPDDWHPSANRITIRAQPYAQTGAPWSVPVFPGRESLPLVLVTLGTVVGTATDASAMLTALLDSVLAADVNVVVTFNSSEKAVAAEVDRSRVLPVDFVPLDQLLEGVTLLVTVGGAGTTLGALSRGIPLVFYPLNFDQPLNAERTAHIGAGIVISEPGEAGEAIKKILNNVSYRAAAETVVADIASMNSADQALQLLLTRTGLT